MAAESRQLKQQGVVDLAIYDPQTRHIPLEGSKPLVWLIELTFYDPIGQDVPNNKVKTPCPPVQAVSRGRLKHNSQHFCQLSDLLYAR